MRGPGWNRIPLLSALCAALALLALPAGASAGPKAATVTIGPSPGFGSATAKCPSRRRATGGGFLVSGGGPDRLIYESRKLGQRSWRASVGNLTSTATLTSYAMCSTGAPKTKERLRTGTTAGIPPVTVVPFPVDASCSKSSGKAQAGGFLGPVPTAAINGIKESYRTSNRTWRTNFSPTANGLALTTYVYCAKTKSPFTRSGSWTTSGSGSIATALSQPCTRGARPRAGGFSQPGQTLSPTFNSFLPLESQPSGKAWQVSGEHVGAGTMTFYSHAYCA
jgi:hypothetical protein